MKKTFEQRVDELEKIMENQSFWLRDGRANEVNYWVFDYPASKELAMREVVKRLLKRSEQSYREYQLVEYDIYDYIIDTLQKEGYLEATYMLEESAGMHVVIDSVFELLQFNERDNWFIKHVQEHTPDNAIVLLTGIGKVYPLLRSHKILNNLSMAFRKVPVILFFPGVYDEQELRLFDELKDDNYYRAFRLVR